MMSSLLSHASARGAVPITPISPEKFKAWEKKQPKAVRGWLLAQNFKAEPGRLISLPGVGGNIARVVICVSDPAGLWDLAALPKALPKGRYVLEGEAEAAEEKWALGWLLGQHRFNRYKKDEETKAVLCLSKKTNIKSVVEMAETIIMVRDMITAPAEDMGPAELSREIRKIGGEFQAKVTEIIGDALLKKNYLAIHAVGRAASASRAPRLIDLTWGNPKHPRVTFVGKGVCFDTGGLNLKSGGGMFLMRKDMAGAAIALGVARLIMQRKLPVRLRLLIPAVENAVGGSALRPSDILTMRNGLTTEVGNTDAEGRLVVADAMAEAAREKPDLLLTFATLGLARSALGWGLSALFANDEALAANLLEAGEAQEDYLCRFPLFEGYKTALSSSFADVNSCPSSNYLGIFPGALFLQRFIPKTQCWAHLDFMAWNLSSRPGRPEGGEAMGLRAAFSMLEKRYAKA